MHLRFLRSLIIIASILPSFFSCNDSKKEDLIIIMNHSIIQSNNILDGQTLDLIHALEEKLKDPITAEKARHWYPKAEYIDTLSTQMIKFLQDAKSSRTNADSIISKTEIYRSNILEVDAKIDHAFKDSFGKLFPHRAILKSALSNSDSVSVSGILNALQNIIRIAEAKTLMFCDEQCPRNIFEFTITSAIIVQNSSHVQKGENIEITAGIGAFSTRNHAVIKINNKHVPLSENGAATYTLNSTQNAGKYNVPVEINYIDQDGKKIKFSKTITYTVAE